MSLFLSLMTLLLSAATLLPFSKSTHWIVRGLDFPRLQLAVLSVLLLLAQAFLFDFTGITAWVMSLAVCLCLGWQLWWILPYTRLWPVEVLSATDNAVDRRLSIVTANVLKPNRNAGRLIGLVRDHEPDVLVTLESDEWWEKQLEPLEAEMPYTMKCPLDNLYGMHVYSRLPLGKKVVSFLVEEGVPSMHAMLRLRTGRWVSMHFLHPAPPSPTENAKSVPRDAELVVVARSISDSDQPTIVTGDLNDVAWSRTTRLFRKISGLLDPRVGRGMFNTYHASYPFLRWPLDHLFSSEHFTVSSIERLPSIGSDHFALLTRLSYAPMHSGDQDGLEPGGSDRSLAAEIAGKVSVNKGDVPRPGG